MPAVKEFQLNMQDGTVTFEYDDNSVLIGRLDATASGGVGPAGANGKTVLSGSAAPDNSLGTTGDFYIRTGVWTIQGPKASGTWPAPVSLIGADGNQGATGSTGAQGSAGLDGKTVLSGSVAPSGGTGIDGDFYIRTDVWTIQGPKASGTWPAPISLIGAQGPAGVQGIQGPIGETGPAGSTSSTPVPLPLVGTDSVVIVREGANYLVLLSDLQDFLGVVAPPSGEQPTGSLTFNSGYLVLASGTLVF